MPSLPYISSPGNIEKALKGIKAAAVPDRVSQDFVKTVLQIPGGSGDQMTAFLKKLDFANSDGTPTDAYVKFRNPTTSGLTMAAAIRHAYARLYVRNEYMHSLSDDDLQGLIVEETGEAHDALSVRRTLACINALKKHANFKAKSEVRELAEETRPDPSSTNLQSLNTVPQSQNAGAIGLNLGYTININLPATTDQAVFSAIFKSLKEHLLRDDDA